MKDRVPTKPGRVTLTPVSGQANIYDMVRADQPTQEGTPLNKEALFNSDAEQAVFGDAAGDHTPAEAFAALPNRIEPIGTIKTTVRTDLGDKWLLCNGDTISQTEYPELYNILPETPLNLDAHDFMNPELRSAVGSGTYLYSMRLRKVIRAGEYYIACFGSAPSYSGQNGCILYSQSINGPWSLATGTNLSNYTWEDIAFYNGAVAACGYNNSNQLYIVYTTDVAGTWTIKRIGTGYDQGHCIAYGGGYWVIGSGQGGGSYSNDSSLWYASNLNGTWNRKTIRSSNTGPIKSIVYENELFVIEDGSYTDAIWVGSSPTTMTYTRVNYSDASDPSYFMGVTYLNGKWILYGFKGSKTSSSDQRIPCIWVCRDATPSGESIWDAHLISSNLGSISGIAYGGGYWVAVAEKGGSPGTYHLYITQNFSSDWIDVPDYEETTSADHIDTAWITGSENGIYYTSSAGKLPAVSGEYGFAYIKAKEGF